MEAKGTVWAVRASRFLPNGVHIDLVVGGDPAGAELAVCSSGKFGVFDKASQSVLRAAEVWTENLATEFRPPFTVLRGGSIPVLMVERTAGKRNIREQLEANLRSALEGLRSLLPVVRTMYLPLLAAGPDGLSSTDSADIMLAILGDWVAPTIKQIWLSAPSVDVGNEIAMGIGWGPAAPPATQAVVAHVSGAPSEERPGAASVSVGPSMRSPVAFPHVPPPGQGSVGGGSSAGLAGVGATASAGSVGVATSVNIDGNRAAASALQGGAAGAFGGATRLTVVDPRASSAALMRSSVSIAPDDWEPHAFEALRLARGLAKNRAVDPAHVLRAAASLPGVDAFSALRSFIEISQVAATDHLDPNGPIAVHLLAQLAYAQHSSDGSATARRIWGRDLVTAALLAGGGELEALVRAQAITLPDLRDRWYGFLVADAQGRTREEWDAWWAFAGVPLPGAAAEANARPASTASAPVARKEEHAGFAADAYTGTDLLGIDRDVNALAALIASHRTELPLAVGLFGEWGSGKSFFMRHLQARVRALADTAEQSVQPAHRVAYWKRIAQIEFNAWHYSDGKIWPSLVQHIFENLRTSEDDDEQTLQRRRDAIIKRITADEAALGESGSSLQRLQTERAAAEKKIEDIQEAQQKEKEALTRNLSAAVVAEAAKRSLALDPTVEQRAQEALEAVGGRALGNSAEDLEVALRSSRDELSGVGGLLLELLQPKDRAVKVVGLLAVLIVPLAVGALLRRWLASQGNGWAEISWVVGAATTFMATAASWVNKRLQWLKKMRERLSAAKKEVDDALAKERQKLAAKQASELLGHVQALDSKRAEEAQAQAEKAVLDASIGAARAELAGTRSTFRLNAFIQERAESHDYRKHLGMMALVRRDFDRLSTLIARSNREELDPDANLAAGGADSELLDGADTINRIVLYIDDLDRCDEETVASVLKAVHLLLAMPLFVVVVAVDPRWLARCLRRRYPELLAQEDEPPRAAGGDGDHGTESEQRRSSARATDDVPGATALDYLEKIFQIPISLPPIGFDSRARVVQTLLSVVDRRGPPPPKAPAASNEVAAGTSAPLSAVLAATTAPASPVVAAPPGGVVPTPHDAAPATARSGRWRPVRAPEFEPLDIEPAGLDISDSELQFVSELGPILSATPRVLKRFANTYRLVKVGLRQDARAVFVADGDTSPYRICMFQMSILVGGPRMARRFLQALISAPPDSTDRLGEWMERLKDPEVAEWNAVLGWLKDRPAWRALPLAEFAQWAPVAARYSFHLATHPA